MDVCTVLTFLNILVGVTSSHHTVRVLCPAFPYSYLQVDMGIPAITKCCNQLDLCYTTCGSNKYRCDSKFRWCLHGICSDLKKSLGFVSKVEGELLATV